MSQNAEKTGTRNNERPSPLLLEFDDSYKIFQKSYNSRTTDQTSQAKLKILEKRCTFLTNKNAELKRNVSILSKEIEAFRFFKRESGIEVLPQETGKSETASTTRIELFQELAVLKHAAYNQRVEIFELRKMQAAQDCLFDRIFSSFRVKFKLLMSRYKSLAKEKADKRQKYPSKYQSHEETKLQTKLHCSRNHPIEVNQILSIMKAELSSQVKNISRTARLEHENKRLRRKLVLLDIQGTGKSKLYSTIIRDLKSKLAESSRVIVDNEPCEEDDSKTMHGSSTLREVRSPDAVDNLSASIYNENTDLNWNNMQVPNCLKNITKSMQDSNMPQNKDISTQLQKANSNSIPFTIFNGMARWFANLEQENARLFEELEKKEDIIRGSQMEIRMLLDQINFNEREIYRLKNRNYTTSKLT